MNKDLLNSFLELYKKNSNERTEFWETMFGFLIKVTDNYFNKANEEFNSPLFNLEVKKNETLELINKLNITFVEISTICNQIREREKLQVKLLEQNTELVKVNNTLSKEKESLIEINKGIEEQLSQSEKRITAELREKLKNLRDSINTIPEYVIQIEQNDEQLPDPFKKKLNSNIQSIYNEMVSRELWSELDEKPKEIKYQEVKRLSIKERKAKKQLEDNNAVQIEKYKENIELVSKEVINYDTAVIEEVPRNVDNINTIEIEIKQENDVIEQNKEATGEIDKKTESSKVIDEEIVLKKSNKENKVSQVDKKIEQVEVELDLENDFSQHDS